MWGGQTMEIPDPANNACALVESVFSCDWVQYSFTNVVAPTASTCLEFAAYQNPGFLMVADIVVEQDEQGAPAVPEPGTLSLLLAGSAVVARRRHRPRAR